MGHVYLEKLPKVDAMRLLDKHQRVAKQFIRHRQGRAGCFAAPGTGKTLIAIRSMKEFPILVICRRDDYLTWRLELLAEDISLDQMFFLQTGNDELPEVTCHDSIDCHCQSWFFVTYDLVKNPHIYAWIKTSPFEWVAADESHMIKRWKSARTKKVHKATRHIPRRLPMTGTPITNDPKDIFSQALFIDDGKTFGTKEWYFLQKYYIHEGYGWYLRRNSKELIANKLKTIAFHVHEDDVLKLPPPRPILKSVVMTGMQRRYYEQVLYDWEISIESGKTIEIDQVIVQLAKLRQIASGFYYTPQPNRETIYLKCSKLDLLKDMLSDNDYLRSKPKFVIWASHSAEILRISQTLSAINIDHRTYFGRVSRKKKEQARIDFRDNKNVRGFVGQVDAGVGMNELIVSDTAIYFSNSFRVVSRQQSMRRIRRRGSDIHNSITYYDLVSENSVDLPLLQSLGKSMSLATMILQQLKRGVPIRKLMTSELPITP